MLIPFRTSENSPMIEYVLRFLEMTLGIKFIENDGGVYYGNDAEKASKARIRIVLNESDVIWRELLNKNLPNRDSADIQFDLIGAIGRLLWDKVGHGGGSGSSFDVHQRLRQPMSFQSINGVSEYPLVDYYVTHLKYLFQIHLGIEPYSRWPKGKKFAIGLSHDVDNPMKTSILKAPLLYRGMNKSALRYLSIKKMKGLIRYLRYPDPEEFWVFDKVMSEEAKYGFKSTSFFAPTHYYKEHGAYRDVPYDLADSKFKPVFKSMIDAGFEIGLHAGYNSFQSVDLFRAEKERLEELAQVEVKGLRHHYWHLGPNPEQTLDYHSQAGFLYDSSLGFNDGLGFRRNTASPYYPWLPSKNNEIKTLQLPVFCMDGNLFAQNSDVDTALRRVEKFINEIRTHEGVGMIDWHTRTSHDSGREFRKWGQGYLKILEHLSTISDAWVTSGIEIAEWTINRFSHNNE